MELLRILEQYRAAGGGACALATIVETKGSAYRRAGARLLIRSDRRTWGAISGGCVESDLIARALKVIETRDPAIVRYAPKDDDLLFGLGSGCNGEVLVFVEPLPDALYEQLQSAVNVITIYEGEGRGTRAGSDAPAGAFVQPVVLPLSLFIFGASPAAEPLVQFARQLGWRVRVGDHRQVALADEIAPVEELPARFTYPTPSAAVVMTHHYLRDLELLKQLLPRNLDYVGLVGSRARAERLASELRELGIDATSLRAPAGLDVGADAPAEIALSIVAEIQTVLRHATAAALRDRAGRIHDTADESAVVVLAAGGSRRMGRPKQFVEVGGKSLLRTAVDAALASGAASVHVVAGDEAERVRAELDGLPVEIVVNTAWREGIASSIRAGVESIERRDRPVETLTLMLCDQPGVSANVLERLLAAYRSMRAPVIASRYPEGPGVPALFHAELFPALKTLKGDAGARKLIRQLDRDVVTIPFVATADIDTRADLESLSVSTRPRTPSP
jgi:xanthine/CO dehydrogenase XdhC/CoxF family maturation factor/GTP:adenosylcobinamide-phosphate guanylyltransferase